MLYDIDNKIILTTKWSITFGDSVLRLSYHVQKRWFENGTVRLAREWANDLFCHWGIQPDVHKDLWHVQREHTIYMM